MKELDESGLEWVDGRPVEMYEFKFSGSILLTPDEASSIAAGDMVTMIVTAKAQQPTFKEVKKAKAPSFIKRINPMKLNKLTAVSQDKAQFIYDSLGQHVEGVNDGIVDVGYVPPKQEEQELGFNPEDAML